MVDYWRWMTTRGHLITPTVIIPTVISPTLITPTVITPTVINTPTMHPWLYHHILSNRNSKQLNRIIARSRYWKYDHECRKTHQIKRVCGTCYAHEFILNAFRHEWSYIQYSRRAIEYRYYIYFIDENKRYSRKFRWTMFSVFLRVNVYLATSLRTYVLIIPFNMFYYIALKYGNFLLETLDTFPLLKEVYPQSRKLYENRISSWYGALQQILNNIPKLLSLNNCQLIKKFQNKQSRKYF
jgi:hypothetical protein